MTEPKWTPGPWDYVASTEHHGPYVTSDFGNTICDCYVMSLPAEASTLNGGPSKPIHHLAEMADPNGRLIAAAPDLYEAVVLLLTSRSHHPDPDIVERRIIEGLNKGLAALAKARGESA